MKTTVVTREQVKQFTDAGIHLGEKLLMEALDTESDNLASLRMHKLNVMCQVILATKIGDEAYYGDYDSAERIQLFVDELTELVNKQVKHLTETDPKDGDAG